MAHHHGADHRSAPIPITRSALREAAHFGEYLWPYKGRFLAALLCLAISSSLALALPYQAGSMADTALGGHQAAERAAWWHDDVNAVGAALAIVLAVQAVFS